MILSFMDTNLMVKSHQYNAHAVSKPFKWLYSRTLVNRHTTTADTCDIANGQL